MLTATKLLALANVTNGKNLGRQKSTTNTRGAQSQLEATAPVLIKSPYIRAPLIWKGANFSSAWVPLTQDYILFHQGCLSVDKESSFHCKKHTLQKDSTLKYTDNTVSKAMETWPVFCRPHLATSSIGHMKASREFLIQHQRGCGSSGPWHYQYQREKTQSFWLGRVLWKCHKDRENIDLKNKVKKAVKAERLILELFWNSWNLCKKEERKKQTRTNSLINWNRCFD